MKIKMTRLYSLKKLKNKIKYFKHLTIEINIIHINLLSITQKLFST